MIRIFWLTNNPGLAIDVLEKDPKIKKTGAWIYCLMDELKDEVELHVCFKFKTDTIKLEHKKIKFYPVKINYFRKSFLFRLFNKSFNKKYYLRLINSIKPDIIHIHGSEDDFIVLLGEINIPIVLSIQGNISAYLEKYQVAFGKQTNFKWYTWFDRKRKNFLESFLFFKNQGKLERFFLKKLSYVIGRTDWDRRISKVFAPSANYFFGDEILRPDFFTSSWNNPYTGGKLIFFTTTGNNVYKGFDLVIKTLIELVKVGLEVEWKLAGIHEKSPLIYLAKRYFGKSYPNTRIKLLGNLDAEDLIREMKSSHIYVMPSHIENSPNSLCEALLIGMPTIATYVGGVNSLIEDGVNGVLIQEGEPYSLTGTIIELCSDIPRLLSLGRKARELSLVKHNPENVREQYLKIYNDILKIEEKKRIKILFVHHGIGIGGAPISLFNIINHLDKSKFEVEILFLTKSIGLDYFKKLQVPIHILNNSTEYFSLSGLDKNKPLYFLKYPKIFFNWMNIVLFKGPRQLNNFDFDILHLNSHVLSDWAVVAKRSNKTVIMHNRETLISGYFGLRKKILQQLISKYVDRVINISGFNEKCLGKLKNSQIIYNFLEFPATYRKPFQTKSIKVLYMGGSMKIKGFLNVADTLGYLNANVTLQFAGNYMRVEDVSNLKSWLKDKLKILRFKKTYLKTKQLFLKGKHPRFEYLGLLHQPLEAIDACDILISPFFEPHFSRPIIEAFAFGKPVIASNLVGMDEVLEHGVNGLLFEKGNPQELAKAINYLSENPNLAIEMGKKGREKAKLLFTPERNMPKLEQLYVELKNREK